ncbi:carboxy terminal-processing peptidase [Hymenobacter saemangeumensis]|uniref:Carboxy terminal-processing peptidase n=1 Tax=Hymenobacter saemangeumensis TaxID=1084522 RepID=A0ABP8IM20_9BACT
MYSSRFKLGLYTSSLLAVLGLASYTAYQSTVPPRDEVVLGTVLQGLQVGHYQPGSLDDQFSQRVFDLYLKRIDVRKQLLLAPEVAQLRQYQKQIDDQVKQSSYEFLDVSSQLLGKRLLEIQALYREILAQPFDFTLEETFETDAAKLDYAPTKAAQREYWRKLLKYQTLAQLSDLMDEEARKKDKPLAASEVAAAPATTSARPRTPAELEAEARKRILKYYDEAWDDQLKLDASDRLAQYVNAIANTQDPHTEYFAPIARDNFDIALSGRLEGTGARLQAEDGHIKVADIVAGSASYRQGELKVGDYLLRVGEGSAEPVTVEGMRLDKVVKLVRGKKGTEVRLTVKKPDGSIHIIPIIRDVVVIEETYAQSALVQKGGRKFGYIHLPGFYADFNGKGGRSSATDVKKELEKLKQENVQGVVLDLRSNGGGSLQDAVEMAGLFVDKGPMVQVKSRQRGTNVLTDPDPQVQYSGPLVVLVNKYSASASEILAAAIQDYKRGVVMGATTYGKGTVQTLFDLDNAVNDEVKAMKPLGSLKLTVQKYYRISGGSTQFKGVVPDIALPDTYSAFSKGEQDTDYPLPWDEIAPAQYQTWGSAPNLAKLSAASRQRVASSPGFRLLSEAGQRAEQRRKQTLVPLGLAAYRARQQEMREASKKQTEAQNALPTLDVAQLSVDARPAVTDSAATKRQARFIKPLKKDAALAEAVAVLQDAQ